MIWSSVLLFFSALVGDAAPVDGGMVTEFVFRNMVVEML